MNYKQIYDQIIENRKNNKVDCYTERHHIIPKSLGGIDDETNLVNLTAREHFVCHFLLTKMYEKESFEWYKMNHAFLMMNISSLNQQRYFNSRLYEALRKNFSSLMSLAQSGKNNSNYGKMWICNPETKENKSIKKDEKIPEGWVKGRNIWKRKKKCKKCGSLKCLYPEICKNTQRLNTFIKYLGFDISKLGSEDFYIEYENIINLLKIEYNDNKLSIEDIKNKYKFNSNEMVRMMFKSLNIQRRSLSESVRLYSQK